jgi:hypothetical protein
MRSRCFLGRRRGFANLQRIRLFHSFVRDHLKMSGGPIFQRSGLKALASRYRVIFVGSDEVWKVDHMRKLDPSFYLDFCDTGHTRLAGYAASASTVTDLRDHAAVVRPLLARFEGLGVRDPYTARMVRDLTGREPVEVLDPTFLWDFQKEDLPPLHPRPYLAVYSWLSAADMQIVRDVATKAGLDVVCVGCRHPMADRSYLGTGPLEWLRLIKHSALVLTDFFHGLVFSMLFERPFYAHVDQAKRLKLEHILGLAGLGDRLFPDLQEFKRSGIEACGVDYMAVAPRFAAGVEHSKAYVRTQLAACAN